MSDTQRLLMHLVFLSRAEKAALAGSAWLAAIYLRMAERYRPPVAR